MEGERRRGGRGLEDGQVFPYKSGSARAGPGPTAGGFSERLKRRPPARAIFGP